MIMCLKVDYKMSVFWKLYMILSLVLTHVIVTEAILCYQCGDSSGDPAIADCMHKTRKMSHERKDFETGKHKLKVLPYLKNCSHCTDENDDEVLYCKIVTIHSHGTTNAFIRGCSDSVSYSELNLDFTYLQPDNQTTCKYSQLQGATECVRLCKTDFCNGPDSSANNLHVSIATTLIMTCCSIVLHTFIIK